MFEVVLTPLTKFVEYVNDLNEAYNQLTFEEQKSMTIFERIQYYNWTFEMYCMLLMLFFYLTYRIGVSINISKANKLFDSLHSYLRNELKFARVGLTSMKGGHVSKLYMDQHLHTWLTSFATGRSSIDSINIKAHLKPCHNIINLLIEYTLSYFFPTYQSPDLVEYLEIEIKPNGVYANNETCNINSNSTEILQKFKFVTSIVNKSIMDKIRLDRYFLSLTHVSDSDSIPKEYVYMSEINQINDFIRSYTKGSFNEEVLDKAKGFLQFISFTDLPDFRPKDKNKWIQSLQPRCVIRTDIPKNKDELKTLNKLVGSMVEVYDNYTRDLVQKSDKSLITTDIVKKINMLRQNEINRIDKIAKQIELEVAMEEKKELMKEKRREMRKTGELQNKEQKMREKRERRLRNKQRPRMTQ